MAGNIKGITIEFEGNTTKLDSALRKIKNSTKDLDNELRNINRALKFNPGNIDLWTAKQNALKDKIEQTEHNLKELKNMQAQLDAKEVDKNSAEYRELQRQIVETESKLKMFKKELQKVGNVKLKALSEQFKQIGKKMTETGKNLTMKVTAPLVAMGAVAANKFAEVDKIMQLTNSTMGNTAKEAELLNDAMKSAAASSTYGMNDAATATLNFARAGLNANQAASALAPAMALAAGEGGELETVSAGLVATINGFHGSFEDAGKYADVFANACNQSALDVNSLSQAMSVAAPIFSSAGYSVKDAALYMGVMANNGIDADKAANSLKTGLARLVSPAKEGAVMMDKLGLSVTNADGSMKDSVTIQEELNAAFSKLSESEQLAAASAIFGKNQMAPWLALINTAPAKVNELNTALGKEGTALEMQSNMMQGFGGSLEKLKSGLDVAATSLGEALAPVIMKVASGIQTLVDWFNQLSPGMQSAIAIVGVVVAAIGPLLVIVGVLASSIGSIIGLVGMVGPAIGGVVAALGPVILIIGAVVAAGVLLYKNWDTIKAKALAIKASLIATWNNIKAKVVATVTALKTNLTNAWNSIKSTVTTAWNSIKEKITAPITAAKEKVKAIIDKIKSYFPFKVGKIISGLKLPHFKLTGKFSLTPPSVPKLSVDWYKTGGIFDAPSVIGVGEAGPEAVVPLDKFWKKLDNMQTGVTQNNTFYITGNDPKAIAEEVERILIQKTNRQRLAWQ